MKNAHTVTIFKADNQGAIKGTVRYSGGKKTASAYYGKTVDCITNDNTFGFLGAELRDQNGTLLAFAGKRS